VGQSMSKNNKTLTDLQEKIWYVVEANKISTSIFNNKLNVSFNKNFELKRNDIIKLGRIKFLIREMNVVDGSFNTSSETFKPFLDCE